MLLKVKFLKLSAGRPVAILNKNFANESSIHIDDRVNISKNSHKTIAVVDVASGMLKDDEIVVSTEVVDELNLKEGDSVNVALAVLPESIPLIYKKLICKPLNKEEIKKIVQDIVKNALTESEIAYFVSSIFSCGMSFTETKNLIKSIVTTGNHLHLKGKIVDKHSIGGVPGRTTPIVVSICAAAGLIMPKTSSRAITTASGTADAMEVLCKVDFTIREIKKIITNAGACIVWGGSLGLAPADDKIIQVERLLNLDPESQLLASIMAKKLAVGSKYILIEIPYGKHAKVNYREALRLKRNFEKLAKYFHVKIKAIPIETPQPLGGGIGPVLEIADVLKVLRREDSCFMLEKRAVFLAGEILELAGKSRKGKGAELAQEILDSGQAYDKFKQIIEAQQGSINLPDHAKYKHLVISERNFKIKEMDIKLLNEIARVLGSPANKSAGIYLHKHLHEEVLKGDKIITLYSESEAELKEGVKLLFMYHPIK